MEAEKVTAIHKTSLSLHFNTNCSVTVVDHEARERRRPGRVLRLGEVRGSAPAPAEHRRSLQRGPHRGGERRGGPPDETVQASMPPGHRLAHE